MAGFWLRLAKTTKKTQQYSSCYCCQQRIHGEGKLNLYFILPKRADVAKTDQKGFLLL